jgi:hypothetical protein
MGLKNQGEDNVFDLYGIGDQVQVINCSFVNTVTQASIQQFNSALNSAMASRNFNAAAAMNQ